MDELLSWYQEEMNKTRRNVFDIAAGLDIPEQAPKTMQEVNDILISMRDRAAALKKCWTVRMII